MAFISDGVLEESVYHTQCDFGFQNAVSSLSSEENLVEIDLELNIEDEKSIRDLHTTNPASKYATHYNGNNLITIKNSLSDFLKTISESNTRNDADRISDLISGWLRNMSFLINEEYKLWLHVALLSSSDKDYRWHTDVPFRYDAYGLGQEGDYNETMCAIDKEFFFLATLKGPSTKFINLNDVLREQFAEYSLLNDKLEKKTKINSLLIASDIINGETGKAYLVSNGLWHGMVHSNPGSYKMERLFVTIAKVNDREIKYLKSWDKKKIGDL